MYKIFKYFLDISFSSILIIILTPIFIITTILILLIMGKPVFYSQKRIGLKNKEFRIYKYRSMITRSSKQHSDASRITKLGKILRITRIDEIPQLYNILKCEMSFIGPRPLLPEYLPYYSRYELRRHEVRPGLSGLSQVSSSYPSWEQQFKYDILYVENYSFLMDLSIFLKTILKVLSPSKKLLTGEPGRPPLDIYRKQLEIK